MPHDEGMKKPAPQLPNNEGPIKTLKEKIEAFGLVVKAVIELGTLVGILILLGVHAVIGVKEGLFKEYPKHSESMQVDPNEAANLLNQIGACSGKCACKKLTPRFAIDRKLD
jgi:hypothetical protein